VSDVTAPAHTGAPATEPGPLLISTENGRLRCVLNRPRALNALTPDLLFALASAVSGASDDPAVRAVVVEGAGGRAFSAGFDIKVLNALGPRAHEGQPLERATGALIACTKPTVALVRGHCLGAGFDLAMSCDFRLATPGSTFSVPAVKIGTVYRPQAIERIWRTLGPTVAKALFVVGRVFDAGDALRAGIVQQVIEPDALEAAALAWTDVPDQGAFASSAQKQIIEAFAATADRSAAFWAPLDQLRAESVASRERRTALADFSNRSRRSTGQ
jgi:enoyl-CoA hydratase/carnithine racemase